MDQVTAASDQLRIAISELGGAVAAFAFTDSSGRTVPIFKPQDKPAPEGVEEFPDFGSWHMHTPGRLMTKAGVGGGIVLPSGETWVSKVPRDFALHGFVCEATVAISVASGRVRSEFRAKDHADRFPSLFPGPLDITSTWEVSGCRMRSTTISKNVGNQVVPSGYGDHVFWPWSPRGIAGELPVITFTAKDGCYRKDPARGFLLPAGKPEPAQGDRDFSRGLSLPFGLDDAFLGVDLVTILWPQSRLQVELDTSHMRHVVIYSPESGRFGNHFALEIQNCTPNAPNLMPYGVTEEVSGAQWLQPGETRKGVWTLEVSEVGG